MSTFKKSNSKREIPIDRVREAYEYDPEGGTIKNKKTNRIIGSLHPTGYIKVHFEGIVYSAHRIAYAIHYGKQPVEIDHINGEKSDNRIENLRSCTRSENVLSSYQRNKSQGD